MRAGVGDTRVSGASALLAEWASQKPFDGIRTRGSQRPDDSQGRGGDMEQEHGAFKVKSTGGRRQEPGNFVGAYLSGRFLLEL